MTRDAVSAQGVRRTRPTRSDTATSARHTAVVRARAGDVSVTEGRWCRRAGSPVVAACVGCVGSRGDDAGRSRGGGGGTGGRERADTERTRSGPERKPAPRGLSGLLPAPFHPRGEYRFLPSARLGATHWSREDKESLSSGPVQSGRTQRAERRESRGLVGRPLPQVLGGRRQPWGDRPELLRPRLPASGQGGPRRHCVLLTAEGDIK